MTVRQHDWTRFSFEESFLRAEIDGESALVPSAIADKCPGCIAEEASYRPDARIRERLYRRQGVADAFIVDAKCFDQERVSEKPLVWSALEFESTYTMSGCCCFVFGGWIEGGRQAGMHERQKLYGDHDDHWIHARIMWVEDERAYLRVDAYGDINEDLRTVDWSTRCRLHRSGRQVTLDDRREYGGRF